MSLNTLSQASAVRNAATFAGIYWWSSVIHRKISLHSLSNKSRPSNPYDLSAGQSYMCPNTPRSTGESNSTTVEYWFCVFKLHIKVHNKITEHHKKLM